MLTYNLIEAITWNVSNSYAEFNFFSREDYDHQLDHAIVCNNTKKIMRKYLEKNSVPLRSNHKIIKSVSRANYY